MQRKLRRRRISRRRYATPSSRGCRPPAERLEVALRQTLGNAEGSLASELRDLRPDGDCQDPQDELCQKVIKYLLRGLQIVTTGP